jgi:hypothetical protein
MPPVAVPDLRRFLPWRCHRIGNVRSLAPAPLLSTAKWRPLVEQLVAKGANSGREWGFTQLQLKIE